MDAGGRVLMSPHQVPGEHWILRCFDPHGRAVRDDRAQPLGRRSVVINSGGAHVLGLINLIEQRRQVLRQRAAQIGVVHICKAVANCRRRRAMNNSPGRLINLAGHRLSFVP
jgi:hypothetical protein